MRLCASARSNHGTRCHAQPVARTAEAVRSPARFDQGTKQQRLVALYAQRPDLEALFAPLMASIEAIEALLRTSSRILEQRAASDAVCARLITVAGFGPITALTYTMSIEDPAALREA